MLFGSASRRSNATLVSFRELKGSTNEFISIKFGSITKLKSVATKNEMIIKTYCLGGCLLHPTEGKKRPAVHSNSVIFPKQPEQHLK